MEKVTFCCCKHLDHAKEHYPSCKLKIFHKLFAYWERDEIWLDGGSNPRDVQFCNRRGRLNYKSACMYGCAECSDYENEERTVEIDDVKEA
jgi:hypothetical protein